MTLLYIFAWIGLYSTIASIWRTYETIKYKELSPNTDDTIAAILLSYILLALIDYIK